MNSKNIMPKPEMPQGRPMPQSGPMSQDRPMPQGGPMPEIMMAIMPDFPRWNRFFFQLDCVFVIVYFLLKCIFFVFFWQEGMLKDFMGTYTIQYLIIPPVVCVIILLGAAALRKRLPETDMRQNAIPVFTMLLINLVVIMIHNVFFITIGIFCIPICMTTVYSSQKMSKTVTVISVGGVLIALLRQFMEATTTEDRLFIIPQGLIAICILLTVGLAAQIALKMTDGQREKLVHYAVEIKEEQRNAEAANEAKSLFLANMSHEIRTPINAILGMNEMILRENRNEQIEEYARNIHSAGNSLLYLVNDVLDISKIESGKLEIMENVYELSSFIHDCYSMVAEKAENKGLELTVSCNPQLPSKLRGDESRLRQVVTNLLSNAAKYTEKGGITLSFDSHYQDGKMMLVINVKDTGIGITEENLGKLFTQFTRFDMEKNRNIEGTGLGLSLAKRLTDLMQGKIEVQSIYGVGSSFTVTIPQQVVDAEPIGDFQQKYSSLANKVGKYHQSFEAPDAKILVVDDTSVNLKVIVGLLKSTKMKVDTATSGRQCLEMVSQTAYDLIFMDHMMPEMDGIDTFVEMQKQKNSPNKNTPVIMLTANAITGVREQFLQAGFTDYLAKPVNGESLENVILKYLPKEKCRTEAALDSAVAEPDYPVTLKELAGLYPKVDLAKGLSVCADSYDVYIDVLKTYAESPEADKLDEYLEQENAYEYRSCVHGVKSSSLSAGFSGLAEQALALENAAREENWDFIRANHAAFIDEYWMAVSAIEKVFQ
ncbi:MAG: response regulator [Lachnospiraceae bacterium]|nr:response regulator [Lachnospiraceae bacterium]